MYHVDNAVLSSYERDATLSPIVDLGAVPLRVVAS